MPTSKAFVAFHSASPFHLFHTRHASRSEARRCPVRCASSPPPARDALISLTAPESPRVGRDEQLAPLITQLMSLSPPSIDKSIIGVWRNAHTSVPRTASPIQRAAIVSEKFVTKVQQIVVGEEVPRAIVNRLFFPGGELNVMAVVTDIEKQRLSLRFTRAWFVFGGALRIPYPVPFRLLGKKACGWLDVVYIDDELRVATGNRGSTFILRRETDDVSAPKLLDEIETIP